MIFVVPGKILEEYTVGNNRLGLVRFGDICHSIFVDMHRELELLRQR